MTFRVLQTFPVERWRFVPQRRSFFRQNALPRPLRLQIAPEAGMLLKKHAMCAGGFHAL